MTNYSVLLQLLITIINPVTIIPRKLISIVYDYYQTSTIFLTGASIAFITGTIKRV